MPKPDARKTALTVLNTLDRSDSTLDRVLEETLKHCPVQSRRDRALLNALVYGTLRWRGRLDWIISRFSKTPLAKIDPKVLNVLRMGLFQILYMDRIPLSAAVNTAVEMAKNRSQPWVAGFVNAVLRNAARGSAKLVFPDAAENPIAFLTVENSLPPWLAQRWLNRFGIETARDLCDAVNAIPPVTVRTNTIKTSRQNLLQALETEAQTLTPAVYSPVGVRLSGPKRSIPEMTAFKTGLFQVQDEAAQMISMLLNPQPGETVLDACAGLGGKTGHIGQLMENRGRIVAMDSSGPKLQQLRGEMRRLGIDNVETIRHDLTSKPAPEHSGRFDRILLDAPCSGLGVLRRNPDTRWNTAKENLGRFQARQLTFLHHLADLLRPGGRLVYAVCSMEPEENEQVVERFLAADRKFQVDRAPVEPTAPAAALISPEGFFRALPHLHDMDGFFAVCFKKPRPQRRRIVRQEAAA